MKLHFPKRSFGRGSALIAVLWLIAILAMAVVASLRVINFDMEIAASKIHGSRARQIAEMGIAVGSNPSVKRSDPLLRQLDGETGEGFEVRILSEGGRFNINVLLMGEDKSLIRSMFIDWGMPLDSAQELVDALSDWVDSDEETALNGAEAPYYQSIGRVNQPFNRPFYHLDEVRFVRGMDELERLRPDWQSWFTIWSGGALGVNEAPAELIAIAAEVQVDMAEIIPKTVMGTDGIRDTLDDAPFNSAQDALALVGVDLEGRPDIAQRFTANDATTRIESTGYTPGAKRRVTVIVRNRTGRPALLERIEEIIP